jgi:NTP pyrophosphatase (non-canonical NTP hydrolase)
MSNSDRNPQSLLWEHQYQQLASRTESTDFSTIAKRLSNERTIRLLNGSLGIQTEGGEIADALKKHIFYGTPLDIVNIAEEVGDCLWYLAIFSNEIGIDFPTIMENNIAKLKARYGEKFSEDRAVNRDLKTERKILENIKI